MAGLDFVSDLKPFKSMQVEKCVVMCTIGAIDTDMGWYYVSCKTCSKKVLTVPTDSIDDGIDGNVFGHTYFCGKCNSYSPNLLPRYLYFCNYNIL
ncbi:hypothetical protein Bca4012_009702 [Brassica carinata]